MHLLIIGGSDAGISAALRAREVDPTVQATMVVADRYPNYSICGLPFYVSGEVADWRSLAHRTISDIEGQGIELLLEHTARSIDVASRHVTVEDAAGQTRRLPYDRLIIATGATAARAAVHGADHPGVHMLHSVGAARRMADALAHGGATAAAVVGGGYIGVEMADALVHLGMRVTLVTRSSTVLRRTLHPDMGMVVQEELARHGVEMRRDTIVDAIRPEGGQLAVEGPAGVSARSDVVVLAVGVRPAGDLAREAGIATDARGAIIVDRQMACGVPDIWAAGDCVHTWHRLLSRYGYYPLGTTAHKQGRIAGENALGGRRTFAGTLGTQTVKVFDLAVASTGLLEDEARREGYAAFGHQITTWDHKVYYPGAREIRVRIIGDRQSGLLLGGQIVGHWRSEVSKRVDVLATALHHGMGVEELNDLDLSYAPPFSGPWDPIQTAAQAWAAAADAA